MKYFIAIDAGIKEIRTVLFDGTGQEIQIVAAPVDVLGSDNERETDMTVYGEKVMASIRYLMDKKIVEREKVLGIAVTGHRDGLWAIDKEGEPVYNAILASDRRALSEYENVNKRIPGLGKRIYGNLGNHLSAGSTLLLLKWMKEHRPRIYEQIARIFFAKDWVRFYLTGDVATDMTDGGSAFFRIHDGEVPGQLLAILGIPEVLGSISPQRSSLEVAGTLSEEAAEKTGLPQGLPVVTGAGEKAATSLGMGTIRPDELTVIWDDTCETLINVPRNRVDLSRGRARYFRHVAEGVAVDHISTTNGMNQMDWMLHNVARTTDLAAAEVLAAQAEPGSGGLAYIPRLAIVDDNLAVGELQLGASYFGISGQADEPRMVRSVFEGLAYSLRACILSQWRGNQFTLAGKAAQSEFFCQLLADVTGASVIVGIGKEFAAKGAMMMGATALGKFDSLTDAVNQCVRVKKIYRPERKKIYEIGYKFFVQGDETLSKLWKKHDEIYGK